jgi:hypothetical protein
MYAPIRSYRRTELLGGQWGQYYSGLIEVRRMIDIYILYIYIDILYVS